MGAPTVRPSRFVKPGLGTISTAGTGPFTPVGRVRVPLMWALPTPVNCRIFSVAGFSKLLPTSGSSELDPPPPPPQAAAARASPATATNQRRRAPTAPISALPCSGARPGAGSRAGGVRRPGLGDVQQQVVEGVALQALLLHEGVGQLVQGGPVGDENLTGPLLGLGQDGLGLGVDLARDALGVAHPHLALVAVGDGLHDVCADA